MNPRARRLAEHLVMALVVVTGFTAPVVGQDSDYRLRLDFGYRWKINFNGSEDLYRSQLDLGEGPKLFGGDFFFTLPPDSNQLVDHIELRMNSWGGEPYNNAHVTVGKHGAYELEFDYLNVHYFNAIPSFANPFFAAGNLETQHKFDTSRRHLRLDLTVRPGKKVTPFFSYQRASHGGPVRTTFREGNDEFLLGSDLAVESDDISGGVQLRFSKVGVRFEQGFRWYRDQTDYQASGFQSGNSATRLFGQDITLDSYQGKTDVDGTLPFSTVTAVYQPRANLLFRGQVYYSLPDADALFSEQAAGNFFALPPVSAFYQGEEKRADSQAKEPNIRADASAEWVIGGRLTLSERWGTRRFHIAGGSQLNSVLTDVDPLLSNRPIDRLESTTLLDRFVAVEQDFLEFVGSFQATERFQFRAGHRYQRKQLQIPRGEFFGWDRHVMILGLVYEFNSRNRIAAEYELGRTNRPILRLDTQDFDRVRINARFSPFESLELRGNANLFNHEDDLAEIDYTSRQRDYGVQATYSPSSFFSFSGEYVRDRLKTNILYVIPQTFTLDRFGYRERGDYGNVYVNLMLPRNARLSLGYSVWGNVGDFPANYHQPSAEFEVPVAEQLAVYGRYNYYDYNEKLSTFPQDYRTHLLVFGFRVTLDKPQP